jgi:hypothetical protein
VVTQPPRHGLNAEASISYQGSVYRTFAPTEELAFWKVFEHIAYSKIKELAF